MKKNSTKDEQQHGMRTSGYSPDDFRRRGAGLDPRSNSQRNWEQRGMHTSGYGPNDFRYNDYRNDDHTGGFDISELDEYERSRGGYFGKGPKGWKRSEERMKEEVSEALYRHSEIDATDIEVSVKDGCVYLKGTIEDRWSKKAAENCAESIAGVEDVKNELIIKSLRHASSDKSSLS